MKQTLVLLSLLLVTEEVLAWGALGHRIVGKVAEDNLSAKAKEEISKLIPGQSLADLSTWADMIKSDPSWDKAKPWHFADLPDGTTYDQVIPNPEGDVVASITEMVKTVKDPNAELVNRQNAVKFIIHFVGDMHQPLHTGRPEDRGGNSIKAKFIGRSMNLHSVWDSGMIDHQKIGYAEYAARLQENNKRNINANYDLTEISFSQIMKENMTHRDQVYDFKPNGTKPVELSENYFKKNLSVLDERLLLGGKRLAFLLNSLFK